MRIVFMGTPDFAVPCLQSIVDSGYEVVGVVTQPDKPKGRKQVITKSPVKILAEKLGIEIYQPGKIKHQEAIERILAWKPDIIVTAAYGQIIPVELLETPKYKAINVHASLLPKYRGAAPIHQSIIQGEKETGITIMYMVKELDAGDILSQVKVPIEKDDTVGSLHDKLSIAGSKLLIETLKAIEKGEVTPLPQDDNLATYAPMLKREDELIDWNKTSEQIFNQIRGLNPWPVAFTYLNNEVFKIWWADMLSINHDQEPGTVLQIEKNKLIIATKDGGLSLKEVQPAGKRKMDIVSYLQGAKISIGEKLGEFNEEN
ncbi:methionyl-tRNA formyltransferase [Vulcanibacillus modesticaldus]|uniref:Methionyl-tRNA formyltransferase n=1 Tax=Vulcanibacillus modesticaldus TaxID=337097 RepID=A0A1D2YTR0_9BACI|nr:methionyl-tRNA formyltransferase [Vulcanibacillus modesticaldus]OEF99084.1 methionyl-tRNA formyltransferase [Vulcanibacillus modesticaldus]